MGQGVCLLAPLVADLPSVKLGDPRHHLVPQDLVVGLASRVLLTLVLVGRMHPILDRLDQTMTKEHHHCTAR
jgi:hypothetical protein